MLAPRAPRRAGLEAVAAAAVLWTATGCALLDPTAYGFVYAGNVRSAEGHVATDTGLQQGRWRFKGDSGQVVSEGDYVDDVRTGPWADYYENGNPKYHYTLKDSKREGLFQSWHPSAKPETAGQFVAGYQFGPWNFYDRAGRLSEKGAFLNDHREGRWVKYHADGSPKLEELHYQGQRVGHWRLTDAGGAVTDIWNDMPDGLDWSVETWADSGAVRREGFVKGGKPVGLWKSYHRDGLLRSVGALDAGRAVGPWHFYSLDAELIARGQVSAGRPMGDWIVASAGASRTVDGRSTFPSGLPFTGTWSQGSIAGSESIGLVVNTWIEEVAYRVEDTALVGQLPPDPELADAPLPAAVAAVVNDSTVDASVPVPEHSFTEKEQKLYPKIAQYYGGAKGVLNELRSSYRRSSSSKKKAAATLAFPDEGGDTERAKEFVGQPLPMTDVYGSDGGKYDLNSLRGKKVVVVVLRGFDGEICPYCVAQTESLCKAGAVAKFEQRNAELVVVFPGSLSGLNTFQRAYESLSKKVRDVYRMRYAYANDVATKLRLKGEKVIPSTFILDSTGIVQFAYVGKTVDDRPTLPLLLKELDRIDAE